MSSKLHTKQKGSALLVALIFLGVLTMVGVSVTLTSTSQLRISANGEDISDTFHATNAGINLLMSYTSAKGVVAAAPQSEGDPTDAFLENESQSGDDESVSVDFLNNEVYSVIHNEGKGRYGNKGMDGSARKGKLLDVSIRQKAKGAICPRAEKGSSVTKIACDHFEMTSKYSIYVDPDPNDGDDSYEPSIIAGAYREMIQSNSATHKTLDLTDPDAVGEGEQGEG